MQKIPYIRKKSGGGPGYQFNGQFFRTRTAARLARLESFFPFLYSRLIQMAAVLDWNTDKQTDRLLDAAEHLCDGLVCKRREGVLRAVVDSKSEPGKKYRVCIQENGVLTCNCEAFPRLPVTMFTYGKSISLCSHVIVFLFDTWDEIAVPYMGLDSI